MPNTETGRNEQNYTRLLHKKSGHSMTEEVKIYVDGVEANTIEEARTLCHATMQKMITQEEG